MGVINECIVKNRSVGEMDDELCIMTAKVINKLKFAEKLNQVVYTFGVTGSGKTLAVKKFMGKKRYKYYSAVNTRPEDIEINENNIRQSPIVIDDLHAVDNQEKREAYLKVIEKIIDLKNIWLVLISRADVPQWLMDLYVKKVFIVIDEDDLCLSADEQKKYFSLWGITLLDSSLKHVHEFSKGHPLFTKMTAMEIYKYGADKIKNSPYEQMLEIENNLINNAKFVLWDYLETHVYEKWDVELLEFMMKISIVENFNDELARMVTGNKDSGRLILMAKEVGNFVIDRMGEYELRTQVKVSMRRRLAKKYDRNYLDELYHNAGLYYELKGDYVNALRMYESCHDENRISDILVANARENPGSGHYFELRKYYLCLSEDKIKQNPELIAGMSMLQSMLFNFDESERWYEELKKFLQNAKGSIKSLAQNKIIYLDIALPHRGISKISGIFKGFGAMLLKKDIVLPEFSVTSNLPSQMNGGKDFCEWSKSDRLLAASIGKIVETGLGKYGKGLVNLALAESFFEKGMDNYEVSELANQGRMKAESGGKLEQCFVGTGILSKLSILNNNLDNAIDMIISFKKTAAEYAPQLLGNIDALLCRYYIYKGRSAETDSWFKQAPDENLEFCTLERFRYLTKVRLYILSARYEEALSLLQRLSYYADQMQRNYIIIEVNMLMAITLSRMGREEWKKKIFDAVKKAGEYHFTRIFSLEGAAVSKLLRCDEIEWKDHAYKKEVIKECDRMAVMYPAYMKVKHGGEVVLSDNAVKILKMQAEGISAERIANELSVSLSTIKYHNQETYKKLGVKSRAAAINEARNRGII